MKLNQLFTNIINVSEAFDSEFDSLAWEKFHDGFIGTAILNNEKFRLYVEPAAFSVNGVQKYWLNIAFAREVNGQLSQELFSTGKNQSVEIGAVVKALREKVAELVASYEVDAIVFVVEKGQEKRISFYKKILLSKIYGLRPWQYRFSIEWFGGTALVATKKLLDEDALNQLREEITSRRKLIHFDSFSANK